MPKPLYVKHGNGRMIKEAERGLVPTSGKDDVPYQTYLAALDPLGDSEKSQAVRLALAVSPDPRFRWFLDRLSEPRYRRYHLATIAKTCDISLAEFNNWWQKAQTQRAIAIAQDGLADLTTDLVRDARTNLVNCERCDGFGYVFVEDGLPATTPGMSRLDPSDPASRQIRVCPGCKGKGVTPKPGDVDARRMVLEMTGMTAKQRSAMVQINQNFGSSIESAVDRMNQITFDVGETGGVVDATVEPPPTDPA